ncbi:MAG TPA: hypothetical protein VFW77_00440 [Candidatus Saccharimonadales bacterium]|nr:hypothetical protein [Candidatus Saccharimonadales bacterium]
MAFWNRRSTEDADNEDESYYIDDKEDTRGRFTSFIFGIAALVITILIATAVVFGVRAIYRAVHGNDSSNTSVTGSNGKNGAGSSTNKQPGKSSATSQARNSSGNNPSSTPSTGDNVPLPKTGDPGM